MNSRLTDAEKVRCVELREATELAEKQLVQARSQLKAALTRRNATVAKHTANIERLKARIAQLTHERVSIEYDAWHRE